MTKQIEKVQAEMSEATAKVENKCETLRAELADMKRGQQIVISMLEKLYISSERRQASARSSQAANDDNPVDGEGLVSFRF